MRIPSILSLSLVVSLNQGCGLSDVPLYQGTGSVTGVVVQQAPIQGAAVSRIGQDWNLPPVLTDHTGRFHLEKIPAGSIEVLIRDEELEKGIRIQARVVADHTSDLGHLTLTNAPSLVVNVMDPDLAIHEARVRLMEIPQLEEFTKENGEASLPCVPKTGSYTISVSYPHFVFHPVTVLESDNWSNGIIVEPDKNAPSFYQSQVYHAYTQLLKAQGELEECTSECHVPEWWWELKGPPCPWPVGTRQVSETQEEHLQIIVSKFATMDRFGDGNWLEKLSCPGPGDFDPLCKEGVCCPVSPPGLSEKTRLLAGHTSKGCWDGRIAVPQNQEELEQLASRLGIDPPTLPADNSLLVFVRMLPLTEGGRLVFAVKEEEEEIWHLFFEVDIQPSLELSQVPPGDNAWVLYRLGFTPGSVPDPTKLDAHFSWINPLEQP